ncbi:tripartite tricarboxylate transporter substrate binding protein [Lampropedia aestuarii]|uniref:tripartite tricarboxylate transporter substrate binding protein n=1 Tax=Lampropedia aestuarii TaxID=2562762 RepID=UPI002468E253|nr:tripartite tricarboxylate transporter substrate binding protein [Lampropedia aestuarii]MDH5856045.1 tripartite tricarboxylate transporter substrate binding protein [Lampropedia aestuarii]
MTERTSILGPAPVLDRRRVLRTLAMSLAGACIAGPLALAHAQSGDFPNKPIQLIVPYGAGGPTDTHLRVLAQQASQILGQSVVLDNKPGANGTFGAAALARAQPDGYTLAVLPASVYREPLLNKVSYDPLTLSYIIGLTDYSFGLAVPQDSPWTSWQDVVAAAKAAPDTVTIGAAGPVQTPSIVLREVMEMERLPFNPIPYKGDSDLAADLLGGHVDAGILSGVASPYIHSGRLRYLVMFTPERVPQFAEVPTLRELGVNAVIESPYGIAAPQGLAPERLQVLHDAFKTALESEPGRKVLDQLNQPVNYRSAADFAAYAKQALAHERSRIEQLKAVGVLN